MTLHRRNPRRDGPESAVVEYLKRAGALVHRLSGTGVPDLLVGYRGRWLLFEVKAATGRLQPAQLLFHDAAAALDLPCYVIHSPEDARRILRRWQSG